MSGTDILGCDSSAIGALISTASVVLIGVGPERNGSRKVDVRDESSNWRETKLVTVHSGCGGMEGTVRRRGGKWSAKTTRKKE